MPAVPASPPSPPAQGTRFTRLLGDGTTFLTVYVVLLFAIPQRLVLGPLGAAGTPAQLLGLAGALWWIWHRLAQPVDHRMRPHPVRAAMLCLVAAIALSATAGLMRPISAVEMNAMQAGVLSLISWLGVLLVAHDGIPDRSRLEALVRRLVLAGGLVATLGIVQFVTGRPFTNLIHIPGLTVLAELDSIIARGGFNRPAGTALHPIEFGTSIAVLLPLALHVLMQPSTAGPVRRWFPVLAIAVAIPLSLSRSAIIAAAVGLILIVPTWTRAARGWAAAGLLLGSLAMFVLVPGFLGTVTHLFTGISGDSSARSRTGSYALAGSFIEKAPLTGRGFLTFLPEYRILDNQYLGMLIDTGVVGLLTLLGLFTAGLVVARRCRRAAPDEPTASLALALGAALAGATVSFAFFDAFSFRMFAGLTFLVLGLIGALRRMI